MRERRKYLVIMGVILAPLVGAALLAVPGSPVYKKPTLGLDLQGGLEVVLQAVPEPRRSRSRRRGWQTAQRIMTRPRQQARRVLAERRGAGQRPDRHPARRRPRPGQGRAIIGTTGELQLFDFEPNLEAPTVTGNQQPAPLPTLYSLLTQVQAGGEQGHAAGVLPLQDRKKKVTQKVKGKKVTKTKTSHQLIQGDPPFGALDPQAAAAAVQGREAAAEHGDPEGPGAPEPVVVPRARATAPAQARTAPRRTASTGTCSSTRRRSPRRTAPSSTRTGRRS